MKIADLKTDKTICLWMDELNPKKNTENSYLTAFKQYIEYTGMTPLELLTEAESDIKLGVLPRERAIKRHFSGFRKHLQSKKYAPITVKNMISGVKSFYQCFDIDIPKMPRSAERARPLEKHTKIPTKEDLQQALKVCDILERAIVLTGCSGGLAANEIRNLTVGKFKDGYDSETEITTLRLRREKVGYDFITFLNPEASRAIWDYLNFRNREETAKEKFVQMKKQKVYSDNDYLFCKRIIDNVYLEDFNEKHRQFSSTGFMKIFRDISDKATKSSPAGDWNLIRSHNMRKYFNSALLNAGCDSFHVEFWMGHTLDDTRGAYFRASPEKMREIYAQYVPYLTIQKELDVAESPEYQAIKKENTILQAETARHVVERSELAEMKKELESIKKREALKREGLEMLPADVQKIIKEEIAKAIQK